VFAQVKFPFENEGSIGTIYTIVRSRLESRGELGKAGKGKPKEDNDSTSYSTFLCFGRWEYIYITGSAAPHRPCLSALQGCDLVSLYQENKHASLEKKMLWDTAHRTCVLTPPVYVTCLWGRSLTARLDHRLVTCRWDLCRISREDVAWRFFYTILSYRIFLPPL
jgi:hypothetical protein